MINIIQNTIGALGRTLGIVRKNLQLWLDFERSDWVGGELVVKDKSPNTNNAKLFTGKALSFDGANDYVDHGAINPQSGVWSFLATIKSSDTTTSSVISNPIFTRDNYYVVFGVNSGKLAAAYYNGGWVTQTFSDDIVSNDSYNRISYEYDVTNETCKGYLNSVLLSSITFNPESILDFNRIGSASADKLNGVLSNLQVWQADLTDSDYLFDYNNPNHLAIDNPDTDLVVADLKAYWAMSEGDGLVAYDSSGEGNNGTINGATYIPAQDTIPQLGMMDWAKGSNLLTYSEDFSNAAWSKADSTITPNYANNPYGKLTASRIVIATQDVERLKQVVLSGVSIDGYTYTGSIWVKGEGVNVGKNVRLRIKRGSSGTLVDSIVNHTLTSSWVKLSATITGVTGNTGVAFTFDGVNGYADEFLIYAAQVEESSSAGNYILTDGAAAIDVTTIQNPTNKGFDILGNALRLRERGFNLDGSGYAEVAISSSLSSVTNGTVQFWLKNSNTSNFVLFHSDGDNYLGAWNGNLFFSSVSGTITQYADSNSAVTSAKITDGSWHMYTFTGVDLSGYAVLDMSNYNSSWMVDSIIDEIVVYDRVLTTKEIKNNYNIGINKHKASSSFSDDFSSDYGI